MKEQKTTSLNQSVSNSKLEQLISNNIQAQINHAQMLMTGLKPQ